MFARDEGVLAEEGKSASLPHDETGGSRDGLLQQSRVWERNRGTSPRCEFLQVVVGVLRCNCKDRTSHQAHVEPGSSGEIVCQHSYILHVGYAARVLTKTIEPSSATLVHHGDVWWTIYAETTAAKSAQHDGILQEVIRDLLDGLIERICLLWVDDIVPWGQTLEELTGRVEVVLAILQGHYLFVAAHKAVFCGKEIRWCGKLYSGDRIDYNPDRVQGLVEILRPENAGELQQIGPCR